MTLTTHRHLPPATLDPVRFEIRRDGETIHFPQPRAALRRAFPIVFEGMLAPMGMFYLGVSLANFRVALVAALAWSYLAAARRVARGERVSTLLILGSVLITLRTAVAFITGSSFIYFVQPMAGTVVISLLLLGSAIVRRPFTQRFAHDFCPLDAELLAETRVQQFFVRISLVWAGVLLVNTGVVLWLLLTASLRTFVLERIAVTWSLTAMAIFCSIYGFMVTMRRDGHTVIWGTSAAAEPATTSASDHG